MAGLKRLSLVLCFALLTLLFLGLNINRPHQAVSAHSGDVFGPACGAATLDGQVDPIEWSGAAIQTFLMQSANSTPLTATLRVMNSGHYLYLGITIADDEFTPLGQYLPQGDGFRIDFDNDHDGALFTLGDDVLDINAGSPQFTDNYIDGDPAPSSSDQDITGGGTTDGAGDASRVAALNHFELKHPLCSGESLDFCLGAGDIVGFRLEYLDAEANGDFGGSRFFPGSPATSVADILIGPCTAPDLFIYLPVTFP
jgi:hypothetical protein